MTFRRIVRIPVKMNDSQYIDPDMPALIFVHGILGFAERSFWGVKIHYFRRLAAELKDCGIPCYFPALPPVGTVADRAASLARYIATLRSKRLFLVGHSMGGLDCRYLCHTFDREHRVRAVVTVGTPHRGTPLADSLLHGSGTASALAQRWMMPGLGELTTTAGERFNRDVPDRSDVRYFSYAGSRPVAEMPICFRPWTRRLASEVGDNDSQVPVTSAAWGDYCGTVRAGHLELVGWNMGLPATSHERPFAHVALYRTIVSKLLAELG